MQVATSTILRTVLAVAVLQGCVYARGNLEPGKQGYKNYPSSIEAEHERRQKRRRHALIAAPIEIVGGLALAALAIYAPAKPSDAMSVPGALGDAGKELLGRALLAGLGVGIAASGVGDGVLGILDPAFSSPLVRENKLIDASEIDSVDPPRGVRFGFHGGSMIGTRGIGANLGFGLAHWISPTIRLRHAATAERGVFWTSADRQLVAAGELQIERAFGRHAAGLYPRRALGLYGGAGWAFIEDRDDAPVLRAGVAFTAKTGYSLRLGTTYMRGDRVPSIDVSMRTELRVD